MRRIIKRKAKILCFLQFLLLPLSLVSWDNDITHRDLSHYAISRSMASAILRDLGLEVAVDPNMPLNNIFVNYGYYWIMKGAELEDSGKSASSYARFSNHFHNPIAPDWDIAFLHDGVTDIFGDPFGYQSTVLWMQDGPRQANYVQGDNSWRKCREYYLNYLLASSDQWKKENLQNFLKALGHQIHLVQDMAVPDHVRNDAHPMNSIKPKYHGNQFRCIEGWAKYNADIARQIAGSEPLFPKVDLSLTIDYKGKKLAAITQLVDANIYNGLDNPSKMLTQGLSEYSNANFFSEDTVFSWTVDGFTGDMRHRFPFPRKSGSDYFMILNHDAVPNSIQSEDGIWDRVPYITKTLFGETGFPLVAIDVLPSFSFDRRLYLDNNCHKAYAEKLIPRAVGYSAAVLDYFFRGKIEITLPDDGVFAMDVPPEPQNPSDPPNLFGDGFRTIKLLAKNITTVMGPGLEQVPEELSNGSIVLVIQYRLGEGPVADSFKNPPAPSHPGPEDGLDTYHQICTSVSGPNVSIPSDNPQLLEFQLSEILPLNATDIKFILVYTGDVGNEENSVAIGVKDIGEPTPVDIFNSNDRICLFNQWMNTGELDAVNMVDAPANGGNGNGIADEACVIRYDMIDVYVRFSPPPADSSKMASINQYNHRFSLIPPGSFRRIFVLTDCEYNISAITTLKSNWLNDDPAFKDKFGLWPSWYEPFVDVHNSITNQTNYVKWEFPNILNYLWTYPLFKTFRTIPNYWALVDYQIDGYPSTSNCQRLEEGGDNSINVPAQIGIGLNLDFDGQIKRSNDRSEKLFPQNIKHMNRIDSSSSN